MPMSKQEQHMAHNPGDGNTEPRSIHDCTSLSEYVDFMGGENNFEDPARSLRQKLGVAGLVNLLQDPDDNGAPLLFQAMTKEKIFLIVKKVILDSLGIGGLRQQVTSTDDNGKTFLMYAARYGDLNVFGGSLEVLESYLGETDVLSHFQAQDNEGKTFLHHAVQANNDKMLGEVISALRTRGRLDDFRSSQDKEGRTPAMCFLGRRKKSSEAEQEVATPQASEQNEGVRTEEIGESNGEGPMPEGAKSHLIDLLGRTSSIETHRIQLTSPPESESSGGLTGIMHATRGGWESFDLVLRVIMTNGQLSTPIPLYMMLGLKPGRVSDTRRFPQFLAQAALGGDKQVLQEIERAIDSESALDTTTNPGASDDPLASWAIRTDYPIPVSDLLQASCRDHEHDDDDRSPGESTSSDRGTPGHAGNGGGFKASLFALTVISGNEDAVEWAASCVLKSAPAKAWDVLRGKESAVSPLAYATSTSCSIGVYKAVCGALKTAANEMSDGNADKASAFYRDAFLRGSSRRFTPLIGAIFGGNPNVVKRVLESIGEQRLSHREILNQIEDVLAWRIPSKDENRDKPSEIRLLMHGCKAGIPKEVVDAIDEELNKRETTETADAPSTERPEQATLRRRFNKAVRKEEPDDSVSKAKLAFERGSFNDLRNEIENGWDCSNYLPTIISRIEKDEAGVISIVFCAIENARRTPIGVCNPFVMSSIASSCISDALNERSAERSSLDKLQRGIDRFTIELLSKLPSTVRGVGLKLMGSFNRKSDLNRKGVDGVPVVPGYNQDMAILVGYVAVRWMLEPSLHGGASDHESPGASGTTDTPPQQQQQEEDEEQIHADPLQQALKKATALLMIPGPKSYKFGNTPLVLDYMELKWSCTIPKWPRRYPLDCGINEGFYTYGNECPEEPPLAGQALERSPTWACYLLRFLQGWESNRMMLPWFSNEDSFFFCFPHTAVVPALQFTMAGTIGKPEDFFLVPRARFFYDLYSYLFMIGLYCSCVSVKEVGNIPSNEIAFYVLALGLLWREILEFHDVFPAVSKTSPSRAELEEANGKDGTKTPPRRIAHRLSIGVQRYFNQDNWNILDTLAIMCFLVAFIFRILALGFDANQDILQPFVTGSEDLQEEAFFIARLFLAAIAPLLFARALSLAQVEKYLGAMTQIIWSMLFHLVRFSLFMLFVMASFALAFYAIYGHCTGELRMVYGTFTTSLLAMFKAMLGEPNFDLFDEDLDACTGPFWKYDAGIALLSVYMVTMAILMLNLLIAVLSTVHDTVHENAELEFELSRNQIIQRQTHVVQKGRLPPPFNLLLEATLIMVDVVGELLDVGRRLYSKRPKSYQQGANASPLNGTGGARGPAEVVGAVGGLRGGSQHTPYQPLSQTKWVLALQGALQRLIFALTMGLLELGGTAALWVVSLPYVALRLLRWQFSANSIKFTGRQAFLKAGHFRPVLLAVILAFGLGCGLVGAVLFCSLCILLSVILWLRGLVGVIAWWRRQTVQNEPFPDVGKGSVMPGAWGVDGKAWKTALDIVQTTNAFGNVAKDEISRGTGSRHFNVEFLLILTTGWHLGHVSLLARRKEEKLETDKKMLQEIDGNHSGVANVRTPRPDKTKNDDNGQRGRELQQHSHGVSESKDGDTM